jgi:hypothetical protein
MHEHRRWEREEPPRRRRSEHADRGLLEGHEGAVPRSQQGDRNPESESGDHRPAGGLAGERGQPSGGESDARTDDVRRCGELSEFSHLR